MVKNRNKKRLHLIVNVGDTQCVKNQQDSVWGKFDRKYKKSFLIDRIWLF